MRGSAAIGGAVACRRACTPRRPRRSPTRRCRATGTRSASLLKQAADVNAAQGDGMTALHWAAMKNDADLVQTLLFAGANVQGDDAHRRVHAAHPRGQERQRAR